MQPDGFGPYLLYSRRPVVCEYGTLWLSFRHGLQPRDRDSSHPVIQLSENMVSWMAVVIDVDCTLASKLETSLRITKDYA